MPRSMGANPSENLFFPNYLKRLVSFLWFVALCLMVLRVTLFRGKESNCERLNVMWWNFDWINIHRQVDRLTAEAHPYIPLVQIGLLHRGPLPKQILSSWSMYWGILFDNLKNIDCKISLGYFPHQISHRYPLE